MDAQEFLEPGDAEFDEIWAELIQEIAHIAWLDCLRYLFQKQTPIKIKYGGETEKCEVWLVLWDAGGDQQLIIYHFRK